MERACESGLTPKEFWSSTLPEIMSMIEGYNKRTYHLYYVNRALRYQIAFMMSKNQPPEIYDWEPLDGDPTKEERERAKKQEAIAAEQDYISTKRFYESQGIDVM